MIAHQTEVGEGSPGLDDLLPALRCPGTGEPLRRAGEHLVSVPSGRRYRINDGIPLFAEQPGPYESQRQQAHYDRVAANYLTNLGYPHTKVYMDYLDASLRKAVGSGSLGTAVEICSGAGEGFELFRGQIDRGIGVDISEQMLRAGQKKYAGQRVTFLQGDATRLPLVDAVVDNVIALGGIHHVNDREALFGEVARVLKPGGRFLFREPVSDMVLWRVLRAAIYRLSPALDYDTERPLTSEETKPVLQRAGLRLAHWRTYGSIGFCLFMNSDVLVFNRAFRHLPGIGRLTRWATLLDDMITRQPLLQHTGLQVIGIARKPD